MDADELLKRVTIVSPCEANWAAMNGDDRVRSCSACGKEVYNFEALTAQDAASLVVSRDGNVCGRILRRSDGTIATATASSRRRGPFSLTIGSLMATIAAIAAYLGLLRLLPPPSTRSFGGLSITPPQAASQCDPNDDSGSFDPAPPADQPLPPYWITPNGRMP
jgi:hypothetical protein